MSTPAPAFLFHFRLEGELVAVRSVELVRHVKKGLRLTVTASVCIDAGHLVPTLEPYALRERVAFRFDAQNRAGTLLRSWKGKATVVSYSPGKWDNTSSAGLQETLVLAVQTLE